MMNVSEWVDVFQSATMLLIVVTQVGIWLLIRNEMRRAASAVNVMSRAMGEGSDLSRRVEQLEDDLAELVMRVERASKP
jgi:hypothetical protein